MQSKANEMKERALVTPRDHDGRGRRMDKAKRFVVNKLNEYERQIIKKKVSAQH